MSSLRESFIRYAMAEEGLSYEEAAAEWPVVEAELNAEYDLQREAEACTKYCRRCGHPLDLTAGYCGECGAECDDIAAAIGEFND